MMIRYFNKAIVVSVIIGIAFSLLATMFLTTYTATSATGGVEVVMGLRAFLNLVSTDTSGLLVSSISYFLYAALPTFVGCLWLGKWLQHA